jgi:hypothetical protein
MRPCCPPSEGCNAPAGDECCALTALRNADTADAAHALELWQRYVHARGHDRRFLRRAYARARDRALGLWTPWNGSPLHRAA